MVDKFTKEFDETVKTLMDKFKIKRMHAECFEVNHSTYYRCPSCDYYPKCKDMKEELSR